MLLLAWFASPAVLAHEVRPAYLSLEEASANNFSVVWKRPTKEGSVPDLTPLFPKQCQLTFQAIVELTGAAKVQRGTLRCDETGLTSGEIRINGLATTLMDVLVRIQWLDGESRQQLVKRSNPVLSLDQASAPPVADYIGLGFEHILTGYDHLLFLLALLLIVPGKIPLLKTITAFTLAHSITLALATLGVVNVSPGPVEACIALSIALIAAEAVYLQRGISSLATDKPWLIAFLFGLLHGLGFAGALTDVGLPEGDIPLALLLFNVGIELGQLLFVFLVLALVLVARRMFVGDLRRWLAVPAYGIGGLGTYWALERVVGILA